MVENRGEFTRNLKNIAALSYLLLAVLSVSMKASAQDGPNSPLYEIPESCHLRFPESLDFADIAQSFQFLPNDALFNTLYPKVISPAQTREGEPAQTAGNASFIRDEEGNIAIMTIEHVALTWNCPEEISDPRIVIPVLDDGGNLVSSSFAVTPEMVELMEDESWDAAVLIYPPADVVESLEEVVAEGHLAPVTLSTEPLTQRQIEAEQYFAYITFDAKVVVLGFDPSIFDSAADSNIPAEIELFGFTTYTRDSEYFSSRVEYGDSGSSVFEVVFNDDGTMDYDATFGGKVVAVVRNRNSNDPTFGIAYMLGDN